MIEKTLKAAREKQQITYNGTPIMLPADFSAETLQARREWQDMPKVVKGKKKKSPTKNMLPARPSFGFERKIKRFRDQHKLREFSSTKPTLQQILKGVL